MSNINKQAYEQAQKELLENKVKEIKGYILETLEKIEKKKEEKERVEEELRILKLDIEDLRNGKFDKIEERLEKSKVARGVTVIPTIRFHSASPFTATSMTSWIDSTSGTYTLTNGSSFYF